MRQLQEGGDGALNALQQRPALPLVVPVAGNMGSCTLGRSDSFCVDKTFRPHCITLLDWHRLSLEPWSSACPHIDSLLRLCQTLPMSLFQLREWWRHQQAGSAEEFDAASMCIGNVDNSAQSKEKIVTGSFSGILRVFKPNSTTFSPSHVLLEHQLAEPILQVSLGHFAASASVTLAVLHPRRLAVYQLEQPDGCAEDAPFLELTCVYSNLIPHTAANMAHGRFGHGGNVDSILVQAFDGQVYIFEGGQQVHVTFFEDFLVPGPLLYVAETDMFVTCSSAYELQAYTYSSIIQASQTKAEAEAAGTGYDLTKRKTLTPTWSKLIGEVAVDLQLMPAQASAPTAIVVVGERTILICSQQGEPLAQRKLEYHPAAAISYRCVAAD